MKTSITLAVTLCSCVLLAEPVMAKSAAEDDSKNPLGCRDVGYEYYLKSLHLYPPKQGDTQSMYFIYNRLNTEVNLYQMRDEESSRSMYFNHTVHSKQWAVFSTTEKQVKFICAVSRSKEAYGHVVDCKDALKVCEYNNVKYGLNNKGNYWIVNSNTRGGAIRQVINYGIIPAY